MVTIHHGKSDKFRVVPIGEVALDALDRWRALAPRGGSNKAIFLNFRDGQRLTPEGAGEFSTTIREKMKVCFGLLLLERRQLV